MSALVDVTLTNNANLKKFLFRAVAPFRNSKSQPSVDVPIVNSAPADRIIFRFTGQQQDADFTFALFDDGTDVSGGTGSSSIETVAQQIQFLMDEIFTSEFDTTWTLEQTEMFTSAIVGTIEDINIEASMGADTIRTGTLVFKRGKLGAL